MDQDELDALQAIYGDDLVEVEDGNKVHLHIASTEGDRHIKLTCFIGDDYPESAPKMMTEGRRGVQNEQMIRIQRELEEEAAQQVGLPMLFALFEHAKGQLDDLSSSAAEPEAPKVTSSHVMKEGNHQVGNPLITDGTRCTENVFLVSDPCKEG